jgi:hypothetical protein
VFHLVKRVQKTQSTQGTLRLQHRVSKNGTCFGILQVVQQQLIYDGDYACSQPCACKGVHMNEELARDHGKDAGGSLETRRETCSRTVFRPFSMKRVHPFQ